MKDDLYKAAVEKAAQNVYEIFPVFDVRDGEPRSWEYAKEVHPGVVQESRRFATAALDAIGFREIVEALKYYADEANHIPTSGGEGEHSDIYYHDNYGDRARAVLDCLKSSASALPQDS
jgi:hypothetical protein